MDPLFSTQRLDALLQAHERQMYDAIDTLGPKGLLERDANALADHFEAENRLFAPVIHTDRVEIEGDEAKIDVSQDPGRNIPNRSRPFEIAGLCVQVRVPFTGNPRLLHFTPSRFGNRVPCAAVRRNTIFFEYNRVDHDAIRLKAMIDEDIANLTEWVSWVTNDVAEFNGQIRHKAKAYIDQRRAKHLKDQALLAGLGLPIRKRPGDAETFAVPAVRPRVFAAPAAPAAAPAPAPAAAPDKAIDMKVYDQILDVLRRTGHGLELLPETLKDLGEEDFRQLLLITLNIQFDGGASGETFHKTGKTDILVTIDGKAAFIAECKIWGGAGELTKAIDQLLGYVAWRDTKTAIVIFNRNKNFTAVLEQIPPTMRAHANFVRDAGHDDAQSWGFVFHHPDDKARLLHLAVLAFEVPPA